MVKSFPVERKLENFKQKKKRERKFLGEKLYQDEGFIYP